MDPVQIVQRSLSGYIFVIPGLALYFLLLKSQGKKQTTAHTTGAFVFCYYLIGVLTVTGIGKLKAFSPRIVFIPFLDMISGPIDAALNVVLFLPFGFFLSLLYPRYRCMRRIALAGLLFSASIEFLQMFGRDATDINDLITNTAGACLGYFLYRALSRGFRGTSSERFPAAEIREQHEILFFAVYAFAVMTTVQPVLIRALFRLG